MAPPFLLKLPLAKLAHSRDTTTNLRQLCEAKLDDFFFLLNDLLSHLVHISSVRYVAI
jgi:hypothetical protein